MENVFDCTDGIKRNMDQIKQLTERGIKVSITGVQRKKYKKREGRLHYTKVWVVMPTSFSGGGWTE